MTGKSLVVPVLYVVAADLEGRTHIHLIVKVVVVVAARIVVVGMR